MTSPRRLVLDRQDSMLALGITDAAPDRAAPVHRVPCAGMRISSIVLLLALPAAEPKPSWLAPVSGTFPPSVAPVILRVVAGSPAARSGMTAGDTLWSIDGWPIRTHADLKHVFLRRRDANPARIVLGKATGRREVA